MYLISDMMQNASETHITIFLNSVMYSRTKSVRTVSKPDHGASVLATKSHMSYGSELKMHLF